MKILYFGTVCDLTAYDKRLEGCPAKPSVAPILFETALLEGFHQNGAEVEINSFPMIPTFPRSGLLCFGGQEELLPSGYTCRWLQTLNLPVFKQLSRRWDGRRIIKDWLKKNRKDGVILTYSIPPFLVKDVLALAGKAGAKTVAIVPDLLRDMYINEKKTPLVTRLKKQYLVPALKLQGEYDGYVYLTEAMGQVVAPGKPYIVMEGIANTHSMGGVHEQKKSFPRGVMYAGMLHTKYGIPQLLDAFEQLEMHDAELWLFGDGTAVEEIRCRAQENSRIRYFGMVSHEEILEYERRATLLVNPRDPEEGFTQYSFPSKTVEYMLSGTPLLTTRLKGIPGEYFDYVLVADSNSAEALAEQMNLALSWSREELEAFGQRAQRFIAEEKNARSQAARILQFLEEGVDHGSSN